MVNIQTNLDEEIAKLSNYIDLLQQADADSFLTVKDVAGMLHCSEKSAREFMSRPDFPRINVGGGFKVSKIAFLMYCLERRE